MPYGRNMNDAVLLPNGQIIIVNGAKVRQPGKQSTHVFSNSAATFLSQKCNNFCVQGHNKSLPMGQILTSKSSSCFLLKHLSSGSVADTPITAAAAAAVAVACVCCRLA